VEPTQLLAPTISSLAAIDGVAILPLAAAAEDHIPEILTVRHIRESTIQIARGRLNARADGRGLVTNNDVIRPTTELHRPAASDEPPKANRVRVGSMPGHPDIACKKCGYAVAKILRMTVTFATTMDMDTRNTRHEHASTTYAVKCPQCGHAFSETIAADHN
jgi:DNA-directed RNA polymerase subunit RPC12/RpoP